MKRCTQCNSLMPDDEVRCIRCGNTGASSATRSPQPDIAAPTTLSDAQPYAAADDTPAPEGRIARGWLLAKLSLGVLKEDRSLLLFPLVSGIACVLVLATFFGGWVLVSGFSIAAVAAVAEGERDPNMVDWIVLFAWYFANYFVMVYFNAALVACAMIRFRGGVPTVGAGLQAARDRIGQIAAWALLAATVGVVLRMIENRVGWVGRIVVALIGAAWTIGCYFVVPVLVVEELGPVDAFKRSVDILKDTWGESIVSNTGLGLMVFVVTMLMLIVAGGLTASAAMAGGGWFVIVVGLALMAAIVLLSALVGSALNAIVLSALYIYATEGRLPRAFSGAGLQQAFVEK